MIPNIPPLHKWAPANFGALQARECQRFKGTLYILWLHPLKLVFELPEGLAINERNTDELINHLAHSRLGDGADFGNRVAVVAIEFIHLKTRPDDMNFE